MIHGSTKGCKGWRPEVALGLPPTHRICECDAEAGEPQRVRPKDQPVRRRHGTHHERLHKHEAGATMGAEARTRYGWQNKRGQVPRDPNGFAKDSKTAMGYA
eukprot:scaffold84710_cov33-Tisochrysis_lutea.AAC.1